MGMQTRPQKTNTYSGNASRGVEAKGRPPLKAEAIVRKDLELMPLSDSEIPPHQEDISP